MDRLVEIRARQIVRETGCAAHIPCGGKAELDPDAPIWRCCDCGVVPREEVADRLSANDAETTRTDIGYLLGTVATEGKFRTTHELARFLLELPDVPLVGTPGPSPAEEG